MPASIPISISEKKWFIKLIHEVYGIQIIDAYSCQRLSEALANQAKISISYNTIRRLFGLIKGSNQASRFTLDAISKSLGHVNFSAFQAAVSQFEVDYFNEILILNRLKKQNDEIVVLRLVQDFQFKTWDEVYQLKSIVDLCLEVGNFKLLTEIFNQDFDLHNEDILWKLYVAFQSIFIQSKHGNQVVIDFVAHLMPTNEMAQRVLLQLYVDEEALNSYYGRWIQSATLHIVEDMEMFTKLILIQQAFSQVQVDQAKELLTRCNVLFAEKKQIYHPILLGRLAAWNLMLLNNEDLCHQLCASLNTINDQLYFVVFFYRIQDVFGHDITRITLLEHFSLENLGITFNFIEKQNLNVYYLLKAKYWLINNDKPQMKLALSKFNPLYKYSCLYSWIDSQWNQLNVAVENG